MGTAQRNRIEGLRGARYGEVLLLRSVTAGYQADVWNTMGFNDCPPAAFAELDAVAIAAEHGALLAMKNGPRHWVLDAIEAQMRASAPTTKFGTLEMFLAATIDLGPTLPDPGAYVERRVARDTVFEWSGGTPLHELRAPDGRVYVMQALSHAVDAVPDPGHPADAGAATRPAGGLDLRLSHPGHRPSRPERRRRRGDGHPRRARQHVPARRHGGLTAPATRRRRAGPTARCAAPCWNGAMDAPALLAEIYSRLPDLAHQAVDGASLEVLTTPPGPETNTIAWLVWHPARVIDEHVGDVMGTEQLWCEGIWPARFGLPSDGSDTGYGHTFEQVCAIRPSAPEDLTGYFDEVHAHSVAWISKLAASDLDRIVDTRWDPPVTLAVRLVSVADDCLQHLGQAAYARGMLER